MAPSGRTLRLAPSLLSADFSNLGEAIRPAEAAGAGALHLDVMDGHFVPNISFGPGLVAAVRAPDPPSVGRPSYDRAAREVRRGVRARGREHPRLPPRVAQTTPTT